jgi:CRISPR-associated exonuclease Cas4
MSTHAELEERLDVTGKEIEYLHVCTRKLWLYHHGLRMELENENVRIGMQIDARSYSRSTKGVALGNVGVVDRIDFTNGTLYETKKGPATEKAAFSQMKFYIWWLRSQGIAITSGVLSYPKRKQRKTVSWDTTSEQEVLNDIEAIRSVVSAQSPPDIPKAVSFCRKCAYYDFCYC